MNENAENLADEMIASKRPDVMVAPADMPSWITNIIHAIDGMSVFVGNVVCWMTLPLMIGMFWEVFSRYVFMAPTVWAYDISRMLYGAMFVLGASYALRKGIHIRSDFLYRSWPVKTQALVDLVMYFVLFIPSMVIFLWASSGWAYESIVRMERGTDTTWMPYLGFIKVSLPIGVLFLLIQGISEILKALYAYKNERWPE